MYIYIYIHIWADLLFKYKRSSKGRPFISHQDKKQIYAEQIRKEEQYTNIKDNGRFLLKIQIVFMLVVVQNRVCFFNCVTRIEETKLVYAFSRKFVSVCKTYYGGHKGVLKWS